MEMSDPLSFLNGKIDIIKPGLERIRYLADVLDNPQKNYGTIHVGGTNGKGSTSHMVYNILRKQGYRVGLYTSPHLERFNERIVVDGDEITDEEISEFINRMRPVLERIDTISGIGPPTYFEVTTALAFDYFQKRKVDLAVIEVGLGGRFDATNILEPMVSIITNISIDHTDFLGNEIGEIAFEKAGIIKEKIPVITGTDNPIGLKIIEDTCNEKKSKLFVASVRHIKNGKMTYNGQHFSLSAPYCKYEDLFIPLLGKYQIENAFQAITALEILKKKGFPIDKESINEGLSSVKIPGRAELFAGNPGILVDCAHNPAGFRALGEILEEKIFNDTRKVLLFSMLGEKDIKNSLKSIKDPLDKVIITSLKTKRGASKEKLIEEAESAGIDFEFIPDMETALQRAKNEVGRDGIVVVAGSFYLAGEIRKLLLL